MFGLLRDLANPLAAPPDINPGPTAGTYVAIDRAVGGAAAQRHPAARAPAPTAPRLIAGADVQRMRDDRQNFVSDAGRRTDAVLLDQREKVTELGPFAQLQWTANEHLLLSARRPVRLGAVRPRRPVPGRRVRRQRRAHHVVAERQRRRELGVRRSLRALRQRLHRRSRRRRPPSWSTSPTARRLQPGARAAARGELRDRRPRPADAAG